MAKKNSMNILVRKMFLFVPAIIIIICTQGCQEPGVQGSRVNGDANKEDTDFIIHPDHIIFLWLENKDYYSIISNRSAPFINSLVNKGTLFTRTYAITHPSYPNYMDFFAGQNNGITSDSCIYDSTLTTPNLCSILLNAGKSFAWYSEGLPAPGSRVCTSAYYVEKHNPTTVFANVPDSANKPFSDFPTDYNQLENVVSISPNIVNDMHSGSIEQADNWLKKNLASLVDWCTTHNSIFVIYYDESESADDYRIPVIAVGQQVKAGYKSASRYNHFSWTKTISAMFWAPDTWTGNLKSAKLITGCWK